MKLQHAKKWRPRKTLGKFLAVFLPAEVTAITAVWGSGPPAGVLLGEYARASLPGLVAATVVAVMNAVKNRSEKTR